MINPREHQSITAYINFIRGKGAEPASLVHRQSILQSLSPYIAHVPHDGIGYREGVNAFLEHINKTDWNFVLLVIREYFPFWTNDIKLIAALSSESAFENTPSQWQALTGDLATIWTELDHAVLCDEDTQAIHLYIQALKQKGALQNLIDTRVKLVKMVLLRLQNVNQKTATLYRKATDATVSIFEQKETRYLFLSVVREFYYYWIDDKQAQDSPPLYFIKHQ